MSIHSGIRYKNIVFFLFLVSFPMMIKAQTKKADAVIGKWWTPDNESIVEIYKKSDNKYYGKLIWLKEPNDKYGKPKKDTKNPDVKLRNRTIKDMEFMIGFVYDEDYEWVDGKVYNCQDGETYSAQIELTNMNTLELRGYIGLPMFGKTSVWKRKKN